MYIQLSNDFTVRNEANCSFLVRTDLYSLDAYDNPIIMLPPFIGYILSNIGKSEYKSSIHEMAKTLNVTEDAIDSFIRNLRAGGYRQLALSDTTSIVFPTDLLIKANDPDKRIFQTSEHFDPCSNFVPHRPSIPFNLNLMVTTLCITNCIYCYACRDLGVTLTATEICQFIESARHIGVMNISLTGGDIFAMPHWEQVLNCLTSNGYKSFLSTKTPLYHSELRKLKDMGFFKFQFSLDSIDNQVLSHLLKVDTSYIHHVEAMLRYCDEIGIDVYIRSVLTNRNSSISSLNKLRDFLLQYKCIKEWDITPAFFSKSKMDYELYSVPNEDLIALYQFKQDNIGNVPFTILLNKVENDGYCLQRHKTCEEFVEKNQRCVANTFRLSILASGDCTVCEMLYKNPDYLLGNIKTDSLISIWNSKRALELYKPEPFEDSTTPCSGCAVFDMCRRNLEKRVCYVDIAKINGKNSFRMPDPRCPKADPVDVLL